MGKKTKPREQARADPSRYRLAKRWVRNGYSVHSTLAIVADIEAMEAKRGYRYDMFVPWDEWYKPHPLPSCDRACCRE